LPGENSYRTSSKGLLLPVLTICRRGVAVVTEFYVEIPVPPVSGNYAFRFTKSGQRYVASEVKTFRKLVEQYVFPAILKARWKPVKYCDIYIDIFNTRSDLDNLAKVILDSLNRRVIQDDRYIQKLTLAKHKDKGGGRFTVFVTPRKEPA
jgi:Holliday junction resolvase RusA-like endonuclease